MCNGLQRSHAYGKKILMEDRGTRRTVDLRQACSDWQGLAQDCRCQWVYEGTQQPFNTLPLLLSIIHCNTSRLHMPRPDQSYRNSLCRSRCCSSSTWESNPETVVICRVMSKCRPKKIHRLSMLVLLGEWEWVNAAKFMLQNIISNIALSRRLSSKLPRKYATQSW